MSRSLPRQAEQLYRVFAELVRRYQFRDRDQICCHGLSVSQCYALEALDGHEPMAMGELAEHLQVDISTMTRIVDHLVADKLVVRSADAKDRRVCRVQIARKGLSLMSRIRADLVKEYQLVLREIPPESREAVITAMSNLLSAFKERQQRDSDVGSRKQYKVG